MTHGPTGVSAGTSHRAGRCAGTAAAADNRSTDGDTDRNARHPGHGRPPGFVEIRFNAVLSLVLGPRIALEPAATMGGRLHGVQLISGLPDLVDVLTRVVHADFAAARHKEVSTELSDGSEVIPPIRGSR